MVLNLVTRNANTHNSQKPEEERKTKLFLMSDRKRTEHLNSIPEAVCGPRKLRMEEDVAVNFE
ncbi:hypothetical protein YC2023_054169 [Brassica napus]